MSVFLGIDVGNVSVKIALVIDEESRKTLQNASLQEDLFYRPSGIEKINKSISSNLLVTNYLRIKGSPVYGTYNLLKQIIDVIPLD